MSEQIHYCRLAFSENPTRAEVLGLTNVALGQVSEIMNRTPTDPRTGSFRITYNLDSTFERESVLVEWRPNK